MLELSRIGSLGFGHELRHFHPGEEVALGKSLNLCVSVSSVK